MKTKTVSVRVSVELYQDMMRMIQVGRAETRASMINDALREWIGREKAKDLNAIGANCHHCGAWIDTPGALGFMALPFEEPTDEDGLAVTIIDAPASVVYAAAPVTVFYCQSCKSILSVQQ